MKKRSILSLFLAVVMVMSLFAGCGKEAESVATPSAPAASADTTASTNSEAPKEPVTLKVWESDGPEKEFIEEMAAAYMAENPHVTIIVEPVSHTDAAQRLQLDGPAGVGADVFAAPHDKLGEMLTSGIILENAYANEVRQVTVDAAITATSSEGKLYGFPTGVETYALFYNKKLVSDPPETWEEVKEFCKNFNDKSQGKYGIVWDVDDAYFSYMFLSGYGADLFGPEGTDKSKHMVNSEEAIRSLEYFQNFRKECLDVDAADLTADFMNAGFQNGTIAMVITGPWAIAGYREAGVDFGVTTLPKLPGSDTPPKSFSGIRAMYVSAFTKYPEEAQKFAYYLVSKEALQKRYEITNQIPPRKDIHIEDEAHEGILAQFAYSKPMPSIPAMNTYWPAMASAYANIWNGNDIKTELDLAAAAIEAAP
ncbi:maltose ABC transporter substrate-binding protein [Thermoclostridium caenicola]|uniref:Maltodextrin-binding protein n=1 Tax=Thermoclostridium caenicola TaxID=659425 RepID=A0A1M6E1H3_9FIRM|nr:maltose ABC transporter substrate-binding protein [Thermoclostridium caenicola]SHI79374.1 arabinogalactan oligomer / maltooligosaccharide transport system substrate-binding protein [Thermoclostridium caenicola]